MGVESEPSLYRLTTDADNALRAGDYETATRLYRRALDRPIVPAYQRAAILANLGLSWQALDRLAPAMRCFEDAVAANPNLTSARTGLGNAYARVARYREALAHYDRAIELEPGSAIIHVNRALVLEALGRIEEAWAEGEWRYALPTSDSYYPFRYAKPRWQGEPLHGRTLLVHREQGLGDIIQHLRFLRLLDRFGGQVRFECPQPLVPLVARLPHLEVIAAGSVPVPESAFDCYVPLLSLPHVLGCRAAELAATCPYVAAEPSGVVPARGSTTRQIGFVWSGSAFDPSRNTRVDDFLPLLESSARFVSLRKEVDDAERSFLARRGIDSAGERFRDFGDTRDRIALLDAVIAVDTAVAHLAGAMGVRTWLILNEPAAPRWMSNRDDTPWYPTMRIHRRRQGQSWKDLVAELAREVDRELPVERVSAREG